jgi:hypothetical protein
VAEQAKSAARFIDSIGVNVHISYDDTVYGNAPLVAATLRNLGVKHFRDGLGSYQRPALQTLLRTGLKGLFNAGAPPYSSTLLQAQIKTITTSYPDSVFGIEGQNEPDANVADWRTSTAINLAALRLSDTQGITLVGPPLANANNAATISGSLIADYGSLHPYPAGTNPSGLFPSQINLTQPLYPGLPLIISETGYHNALNDHSDQPGVDELTAAKYIPRLLLEAFNVGVYRTYLYELFNTRSVKDGVDTGLTSEPCNWGLVDVDGREKPAFIALKNLLTILSGGFEVGQPSALNYTLTGTGYTLRHTLLQKAPGVYILLLWLDANSWDTAAQKQITVPPQMVTLGVSANKVLIYDPIISATPQTIFLSPSNLNLMVADRVTAVEIHTQTSLKFVV